MSTKNQLQKLKLKGINALMMKAKILSHYSNEVEISLVFYCQEFKKFVEQKINKKLLVLCSNNNLEKSGTFKKTCIGTINFCNNHLSRRL